MRFSIPLCVVRVLSAAYLLVALAAVGYGLLLVVDDARESTDLYDGLAAGIGWLLVAGGTPVLALAAGATVSTSRAVAAVCGVLLALVPIGVLVFSGGDYAPWPALVAGVGFVLGACSVLVLGERVDPERLPEAARTPEAAER